MASSTMAVRIMVCLVSFLVVIERSVVCGVEEVEEDSVMNLILDNVIANTMANLKDIMEPLAIKQTGFTYNRSLGPIKARAVARLLDIKMSGLSSTTRSGNSQVTQSDEITSLLTINLLISNLTYSATGEVAVLGFGSKRLFKGKVDNVHAKVTVKYNMARDLLTISNVKVLEMTGLKMAAIGTFFTTITDMIINQFIRLSIDYLGHAFRVGIEVALSKLFQEAINDIKTSQVLKGIMV